MKIILIPAVALWLACTGCGHLNLEQPAIASWSIAVTESLEIDRGSWPIVARVRLPADIDDPLFVLRRQGRRAPVAHQLLAVVEPDVTRRANASEADDRLVDVCFFADLRAGARRRFDLDLVAESRQAPPGAPALKYRGARFGTTVDTGPVEFAFDPVSGQLLSYVPQQNGRGERTPDFSESRGPLAYRSVRRGLMPSSNGTLTEISYTVFAGMPFILESSRMEFTNDTDVRAVRHNELVFNRGIHTHGIWPDAAGKPQLGRLFDPQDPRKIYGNIKLLKADIPWIGLVHPREGYGIVIVNNWYGSSAPEGSAGPHDGDAVYNLFDYGEHAGENFHFNFSYVCRSLLPPVTVVKGSVFGERSAFLTFSVGLDGDGRYDRLLRWTKLLGNLPVVEVTAK